MDFCVGFLAFIKRDRREEVNSFPPRYLLCGDIMPETAAAIFLLWGGAADMLRVAEQKDGKNLNPWWCDDVDLKLILELPYFQISCDVR